LPLRPFYFFSSSCDPHGLCPSSTKTVSAYWIRPLWGGPFSKMPPRSLCLLSLADFPAWLRAIALFSFTLRFFRVVLGNLCLACIGMSGPPPRKIKFRPPYLTVCSPTERFFRVPWSWFILNFELIESLIGPFFQAVLAIQDPRRPRSMMRCLARPQFEKRLNLMTTFPPLHFGISSTNLPGPTSAAHVLKGPPDSGPIRLVSHKAPVHSLN